MIDTIKIFCSINKKVFDLISKKSDCKCSYNKASGFIHYEIITNTLKGSFDNNINVRVGYGSKYSLFGYVLEIECSYHKFIRGQNSFDGFYNLSEIVFHIIKIIEIDINIKLPSLRHWFLQRVDVAIVGDLVNNNNVCQYINNLSKCKYPRRNLKFYQDESIYVSGTSTTLKIYNKLREFRKHDFNRLKNFCDFDLLNFCNKIDGYIRFECEIKKKKLIDFYKKKYIRIINVKYVDLKKIWEGEFMKLLNFFDNDINRIREKDKIEKRLLHIFGEKRGRTLYTFYVTLMLDGECSIKNKYKKSWFYKNKSDLKKAGIDFSQTYELNVDDTQFIDFDIFNCKEVS